MVKYGLKTTNIDGKLLYREYLGEIVKEGKKQEFVGGSDCPQAKEIEFSQDELLKNNSKRKTIITIIEEE